MIRSLSLRAANLLYLLTILLVIVFGSLFQNASFGWGLLATELALILAPTLFFLRRSRLPLRQSLRLNRISIGVGLAALLIGIGVWLVDAMISGLIAVLTGYSVSLGPGAIPANALEAAVIAVAFCVAAPVCEEVLFRGAILGAYRNALSSGAAILVTSLMFAFYHMQLQGLAALLPVAFAVTYTAWRSNSLYASMLVHFANNAMATMVLVAYALRPDISLPFPSLPASGIGVLLLVGGIILLNRLAPQPVDVQPSPEAPEAPAPRLSWIARYWPLLAAGIVYVVMAGIEFVTFARPEITAKDGLALVAPATWDRPQDFTFEIRNKADQAVGSMNCLRLSAAETIKLECNAHVEAYEVTVNGGTWMSSGAKMHVAANWARPDLKLASMDGRMDFDSGGWYSWTIAAGGGSLHLVTDDSDGKQQQQALPADALLNYEWPFRLMAADLQNAQANRISLGWQNIYRPETNDSGPVSKPGVLVVRGAEKVGEQTAWRVSVDKFTLWYATAESHLLLKYDDGFETYILKY